MSRRDLLDLISRASVMLQEHSAAGSAEGCDLLTEMGEAIMEGVTEGSIEAPRGVIGDPVREVDLS